MVALTAAAIALVSMTMAFGSDPAWAAREATASGAELSGTFGVSFHVVQPAADRRDRTTLDLAFTEQCSSSACEATVSTLAESCASGSCGQPPSDLSFADDLLRLRGSKYEGTFTLKTGCTAQGTYFPYAYDQRTTVAIRPTSTQDIGGVRQVTRFVGTLGLVGSPDAIGHKWGCSPYRFTLDLAGATET
ncbi:MAG: hypothetical protein ACRDV8_06795 [Acidimicrobiales bacterium]